jgi:SAM-dependent methyltransferase
MDVQAAYDAVADEYVRRVFDELRHKPFDRQLLDRFAARVGNGLICDAGCGPGHIARYLRDQGARVCGIDLSHAMIERARTLNAGIDFQQGDMRSLKLPNDHFAGIAAFYSLIHFPPAEMIAALRELRRVLRPDGLILTAFHLGGETRHLDEWWGRSVSIDFHFFDLEPLTEAFDRAGFAVEELLQREPYPDVEYASPRAYFLAKPRIAASG